MCVFFFAVCRSHSRAQGDQEEEREPRRGDEEQPALVQQRSATPNSAL